MAQLFVLSLVLLFVLLLTSPINAIDNKYTQRRRRTRELEEKINKLDDATKARIHAMKASGMPKEAIADKIAYTTGGKGNAQRIVDALHDEPPKRPKQPKPNTNNKNKKTTSSRSSL